MYGWVVSESTGPGPLGGGRKSSLLGRSEVHAMSGFGAKFGTAASSAAGAAVLQRSKDAVAYSKASFDIGRSPLNGSIEPVEGDDTPASKFRGIFRERWSRQRCRSEWSASGGWAPTSCAALSAGSTNASPMTPMRRW